MSTTFLGDCSVVDHGYKSHARLNSPADLDYFCGGSEYNIDSLTCLESASLSSYQVPGGDFLIPMRMDLQVLQREADGPGMGNASIASTWGKLWPPPDLLCGATPFFEQRYY